MVFVMGGLGSEYWVRFEELVVDGYLELRRHHAYLCTFALLLIPSQMPTLRRVEDVYYLREALCVGKSASDAELHVRSLLKQSVEKTKLVELNHGKR